MCEKEIFPYRLSCGIHHFLWLYLYIAGKEYFTEKLDFYMIFAFLHVMKYLYLSGIELTGLDRK